MTAALDALPPAPALPCAVVHTPGGLERLVAGEAAHLALPVLLQQYVDHGGCLFKVYVLGDTYGGWPRGWGGAWGCRCRLGRRVRGAALTRTPRGGEARVGGATMRQGWVTEVEARGMARGARQPQWLPVCESGGGCTVVKASLRPRPPPTGPGLHVPPAVRVKRNSLHLPQWACAPAPCQPQPQREGRPQEAGGGGGGPPEVQAATRGAGAASAAAAASPPTPDLELLDRVSAYPASKSWGKADTAPKVGRQGGQGWR